MKKRLMMFLAMLLVLALAFPLSVPAAVRAENVPTEEQVYKTLMALQSTYPEGTPWTNNDFYAWNGGGKYYGGYGCVAFAYRLSDAAFGTLPSRYIEDINIKNIHIGDILRINNDTHTVIVLRVNGTESVTIAEGNYNYSVHWGRTLTAEEIADPSTTELQTRYPEGTFDPSPAPPTTVIVGALKYKLSGTSATVIGPKSKNAKKLVIPARITVEGQTYTVKAIGANAFKGMKKLNTVTIGENIKTIGKSAFQNCSALKTVTVRTTKLTNSSVKANAFKGIYKKAAFKCPQGKAKAYQKILQKKGVPKTCKFK